MAGVDHSDFSVLRQGFSLTDLIESRSNSGSTLDKGNDEQDIAENPNTLRTCSYCKVANNSKILVCENQDCGSMYHGACLDEVIRSLSSLPSFEVFSCPSCNERETRRFISQTNRMQRSIHITYKEGLSEGELAIINQIMTKDDAVAHLSFEEKKMFIESRLSTRSREETENKG